MVASGWREVNPQALHERLVHRDSLLILAQNLVSPLRPVSENAAKFPATRHDALVDELVVGAGHVWKPDVDLNVSLGLFASQTL